MATHPAAGLWGLGRVVRASSLFCFPLAAKCSVPFATGETRPDPPPGERRAMGTRAADRYPWWCGRDPGTALGGVGEGGGAATRNGFGFAREGRARIGIVGGFQGGF